MYCDDGLIQGPLAVRLNCFRQKRSGLDFQPEQSLYVD